MNKLEIFQEAYGKDYAFTETELIRLMKIAELIVRECWALVDYENKQYIKSRFPEHFGVK